MTSISKLVAEASQILAEIEEANSDDITSDQATRAYSLHTRGMFLLQKIDKPTYQRYCTFFSKTHDQVGNWQDWNYYIKSELEKCLGVLHAVETSGAKALDKSVAKVFISHGEISPAFNKLVGFLHALGCLPLYDTVHPTQGKTINQLVGKLFSEADFYVILATGETKRRRK